MNLTLYDLDSISKACDNLSTLCKEIKKSINPTNLERQLFVSRNDYNESLKVKNQIPQDFYYFRAFDKFVQIVYNKKTKFYQLFVEGFYCSQLNKYKRVQRSEKSFEISKDFEECYLVFKDIIEEILSSTILQNGLF